ncbi:MAG: efflux RND transporter permease subunit [Saprospiraceae bacterium]|nr:efflux RND transporter permease subunit [Saprospiraceae bacterium]
MLKHVVKFFLENKVITYLFLIILVLWGLVTAPFDLGVDVLPRDPVAVDAIPDIGENQQIVFTEWKGRSPQDVEDQITYPLTTALLGVPGVKSIRSNSMFGFSSIYVIFEEDIEFYWSRSRILEKLNSLPVNILPQGVQPTLGPDATALGQIYWYTLEGRDQEGNVTGGWDLHELRSIQDFYVRFGLSSAEGVAEVASIGGFVREYQVDVDPEAMKAYNVNLQQVMNAVRESNIDIGAQTIEINRVEYFVRGLGYVKDIGDIEKSVVTTRNNVPIRIADVAKVHLGPATRRGVLDKSGAEVVGGVVVSRFGANPMQVINNVKDKIKEIEAGLPTKTLDDGTVSKVTVIPFYDRTELIHETLGTLQEALSLEILITILVILLMLFNLRSSVLVSGSLPVAVLMCFIGMRYLGVDANIVALSGIAIAIGTMVDMGIVLVESMVNRMEEAPEGESLMTTIYEATMEVGSAVITAVATTVISFLPVFTMEAAEGKLFRPLAYTKTFALIASIIVAITILPALAHSLFSIRIKRKVIKLAANGIGIALGAYVAFAHHLLLGALLIVLGSTGIIQIILTSEGQKRRTKWILRASNLFMALIVAWILATVWMPLGVTQSTLINFLFIVTIAGSLIGLFYLVIHYYENILSFLLRFKLLFLLTTAILIWIGFRVFQNTGEEFMPSLDEGSFLLMPTSMPHSGMQENIKNLRLLDMAVTSIPEVKTVVGKAGRVNSALDPAPMSMYENIILYKSEYKTDEKGHRIRFRYEDGQYIKDEEGELIPDPDGRYYRQWRDHINSPDDIWNEIVQVTELPGVTSAPKLQPIETRLVMLQTGMRAPMGIKVKGPDLETIENFGLKLEKHLTSVDGVKASAVFADRIVGKPYLLLDIDREAIGRYGLTIEEVQTYIQTAIGGMPMTSTVEGRERYSIRVRYPRELRSDPETLKEIYVPTVEGEQIPLEKLVEIKYEQGAQSIKSEDGFLIGYVLFDKEDGFAEVEVVENTRDYLQELVSNGELVIPAGISYDFAGNYEQQVRASKRLSIVLPIALAIIFLILYLQFKSVLISLMVFSGVAIAFSGGFIMLGLYNTPWFMDFSFFGTNMRDLFQIQSINLSVAVWVGFLALFGIATDDGVLVATFLRDSFKSSKPENLEQIREAVIDGGLRRVRPAMMTTATTLLALLPILTSTGRGADIMIPMAIPTFGGMTLQIITMFTVPVLYSLWQESKFKLDNGMKLNSKSIKMLGLIIGLILFSVPQARSQSLDDLLEMASNNNLTLKSLENEQQSAEQRVDIVSQLDDPEFGIGGFPLPVETRLGPQLLRLSLSQMFPWFGTLEARKELEYAGAAVIGEKRKLSEIDIHLEVKLAYYALYELERSQEILEKNIEVLEGLENVALSKVSSGEATAADVLRLQIEIEEVRQKIKVLQTNRSSPLSMINYLIDRPMNASIEIVESLELRQLPPEIDDNVAQHISAHPAITALDKSREVARKKLNLTGLKSKPSFGLGVDYIAIGERSELTAPENGRDVVQLKASVRLPLYRKKYRSEQLQHELTLDAIDAKMENKSREMQSRLISARSALEVARMDHQYYQGQIRLTRAAMDVLEARYRGSGEGFDDLLQLERQLFEYELNMLKTEVRSNVALSRIENLLAI